MKRLFVCFLYVTILYTGVGHTHDLADAMNRVLPSITYIRAQQFQTIVEVNKETQEVTEKEVLVSPIIGTGFIVNKNIVVTNHHVVEDAIENDRKISIMFIEDNMRYEATIIGYDIVTDVALLKIEGEHPSVKINISDDLRMGAEVFTISHFYGIGWSGTTGIISSITRSDQRYPYINNIQLQILSGTGSSGGPVFNEDGEVVGLNRSIISMQPRIPQLTGSTRQLSMVAFPVRGDSVVEAIKRILAEKIVVRVDLGVGLVPFGGESAYHTNEDSEFFTGVIVFSKDNDSKTALETSDLIISVDDTTFTNPAELLEYLDNTYDPGDVVKMYVYRNEKIINIDVTLESIGT